MIPPWDTQLPWPPSMSKAEDADPDDLTAPDLRWRAIMMIISWYIADFHHFFLTLLEPLY